MSYSFHPPLFNPKNPLDSKSIVWSASNNNIVSVILYYIQLSLVVVVKAVSAVAGSVYFSSE
jgi:hypothetical protein